MSESFPSAEVSTFSSLLTPSPQSAEDSYPWANAWLLKSLAGIKTLSHDTEALTGWSAVSPSSTYSWEKGSAQCLHAKSPGYICADTEWEGGWWSKTATAHMKRPQVGVTALAECLQAPESIWGEKFVQTRHCIQFVILWVWTVRKHTSGVRSETRFEGLHLTPDMLDVNFGSTCCFFLAFKEHLKRVQVFITAATLSSEIIWIESRNLQLEIWAGILTN